MRELVAPNADGNQCGGALFRGRDEWEQRTKEVFEAFPDIHVTIEEMIAEGDLVAVRSLGTATQERALADIARTGNRVQLRNFDMFRVENGRITFADSHPDTLGVLRQLGQVEVPPAFARLIELPQPPTA